MLTLSLLRHAKSSWDIANVEDFERPLAERGLKTAPLMGAYLYENNLRPDLIICSAAVRTRATLDLVMPFFDPAPPALVYEDSLYLASASQLLNRLRSVSARWSSVMMIGHNPGLHELAMSLPRDGDPETMAALSHKFPTAGLAVIAFDKPSWAKIAPRTGHLTHFVTPSILQRAN
ncbi:MAG: histidine phosphatase family protein [Hyphomicrobiaceae bacterium]